MKRRKDNRGRVLEKGESQRKDGLYMYQFKSLSGQRKCIYSKDLNELRKREKKIKKDLEDGIDSDNAMRTLNEQFDFYMSLKNDISMSTRNGYLSIWNNNVRDDLLGNKMLRDIKKSDILRLYSKTNLSYSSLKELNSLIFRCIEMAVDDDSIRKNPCKGCIKEFSTEIEKKDALTLTEQNEFLKFLKEDSRYYIYYPMIAFAIETALRCGELTGLTWDDVDFTNRKISINHQIKYIKYPDGCKFVIDTPKTVAGIRVIPMTNFVANLLLKQKKLQIELNRRTDVEIDGYKNFVFSTRNKTPLTATAVNRMLNNSVINYNAIHENKIRHFSCHILRHTGCTRMAEAGVDPKVLQYLMGHSDISVTMDTYNHVSEERCVSESKKLEKMIV